MRVLVTRPARSAALTASRLRASGHQPILLPLTEAWHEHDAIAAALRLPFAALALTSAEAVAALASVPEGPALAAGHPVYCVGAATARAADALGLAPLVIGPGDGRGLAEAVIGDWNRAHDAPRPPSTRYLPGKTPSGIATGNDPLAPPLLYLAGKPRAPDFEAGLNQAGIPVRPVEAYRMAPRPIDMNDLSAALVEGAPEAALFYSREAVLRLADVMAQGNLRLSFGRVLCLGARVAQAVPVEWGRVAVADSPDEDSLLALLDGT
ncbi:hypothetical protein BJF93_20275 [Xaviernesmea oryzae]|uniref:Tetrapyrrole biosynthesis uroporphyrinogen III synthase domain-containing protein n=1 Tax=Xaviernesmea oryzae TaxID=464029 RepID=A0A1Q9AVU1_9HYPH|nr:uroporphyrinogen-III synthase [Xaviernesmea oryzae]OLP59557.1 hypothetical protein BJF93_20275 [Xaviernesmea oryzae]SEM13509.1 uroporphyrinogen-III synthase [Xaviernesmea oryzae]